jgi:hypothetical protein
MNNLEINEFNKLMSEYENIQNQIEQLEKSNVINYERITNYKSMMENIILEYHKLCTKLFN